MRRMPLKDPPFTIGIEEEYLLVDRASRDLVREMPQALFEACEQALRGQVAVTSGATTVGMRARATSAPGLAQNRF